MFLLMTANPTGGDDGKIEDKTASVKFGRLFGLMTQAGTLISVLSVI